MAREPGEPKVSISLTNEGVSLSINTLIRGDGTDWDNKMAGTWASEIWDKTLTLAQINLDYGILVPSLTPALTSGAPTLLPAPAELPVPPTEAARLNALIERSVENGNLPNPAPPRLMPVDEWRRRVLAYIGSQQGVRSGDLCAIDPHTNRNSVQQRLYDMRDKGLVRFQQEGNHHTRGKWYLVQRESETEAALPKTDLVTRILPYTRGKRFLMLGGVPNIEAKHRLEATLSLAELRWPEFDEQDPAEWRLREIRKPEIDLVIITRFNKRYSRHYLHEAQDLGKPCMSLTKGYGVQTIAMAIEEQVLARHQPGHSMTA